MIECPRLMSDSELADVLAAFVAEVRAQRFANFATKSRDKGVRRLSRRFTSLSANPFAASREARVPIQGGGGRHPCRFRPLSG
jgi:hypothetical protein